ncbi:hypothetical protein [Neobacillus soli]|nr:hypothetical protein [Neobacillus soli]
MEKYLKNTRGIIGNDIFILSAVRTPVGRYGGALKNVNSGELAVIVN